MKNCFLFVKARLAILHFNRLRDAENSGERFVIREKRVFSKAKNDWVIKKVKNSVEADWKLEIMEGVLARKWQSLHNDVDVDQEEIEEDELEFEIDDDGLIQQLIDLDIHDEDYIDIGMGEEEEGMEIG